MIMVASVPSRGLDVMVEVEERREASRGRSLWSFTLTGAPDRQGGNEALVICVAPVVPYWEDQKRR